MVTIIIDPIQVPRSSSFRSLVIGLIAHIEGFGKSRGVLRVFWLFLRSRFFIEHRTAAAADDLVNQHGELQKGDD